MNSNDESVLDLETLGELMDLDEGEGTFLTELVEAYRKDSPIRITEIERCLNEGNADGIAKAAHALKGSSGNIGAKRLMVVAYQMEKKGKAENLEGATEILDQIKKEFNSADHAFTNYLEKKN